MQQFTVQAGKSADAATLQQSLDAAQKTGVLQVPEQALCLTVSGGTIELEDETNGR